MFEVYYSEKLRELEVERLRRRSPHQISVLEEASSWASDETTFLGALLTRMKALTIQRVVTHLPPRRPRRSQRERACSDESAT